MKRPSIRRVYSTDNLPMVRFWFHGPKWKRHCGVVSVALADISPESARLHTLGKKILMASLEDEVRERILERVYHDKWAMWSDARERLLG